MQQMARVRTKSIFGLRVPEKGLRSFAGGFANAGPIRPGAGFGNFVTSFQGAMGGALRSADVYDESQRRTQAEERQQVHDIAQANQWDREDQRDAARLSLATDENARQWGEYNAKMNAPPTVPKPTEREAKIADWLDANPGKTRRDYVNGVEFAPPQAQPSPFEKWQKLTPQGKADYSTFSNVADATPASTEDNSWLGKMVITTSSGHKIVNVSEMTGEKKNVALKWAADNGMVAVGKDELGALQDISTAKHNIGLVLDTAKGFLPKDAKGRITVGPGNKIRQFMQTREDLSSFYAFRGAAIRSLRALAGSKGLRLNQKEIDIAVKTEIPDITDTWPVALAKMGKIRDLLDSAERPLVTTDWRDTGTAHPLDRFAK